MGVATFVVSLVAEVKANKQMIFWYLDEYKFEI